MMSIDLGCARPKNVLERFEQFGFSLLTFSSSVHSSHFGLVTEMSLEEGQGSKKEDIQFSYKFYQCGNNLAASKNHQSMKALVH